MSVRRVSLFTAGMLSVFAITGITRTLAAGAQEAAGAQAAPGAPASTGTQYELPVALVLVPQLDRPNARALLIRRSTAIPPDVILVTAATRAPDLVEAVRALYRSRAQFGTELPRDLQAYILPASAATQRSRNLGFAQQELARLRHATPQDVQDIGHYPVILSRMNPPAP